LLNKPVEYEKSRKRKFTNLKILGIHDGHNATAVFIDEGKVISMVSEERFTNKKNQGGFPKNALQWILDQNQLSVKDVDFVAFPHLVAPIDYTRSYGLNSPRRLLFMALNFLLPRFIVCSNRLIKPYISLFSYRRRSVIKGYCDNYGIEFEKVRQVEHHLSHGYAALYASGFVESRQCALIFTCDDSGDGVSNTVGIWNRDVGYQRIQTGQTFNSLGDLYSRVTQHLGMKMGEHEYKVMGMAPYVPEQYSEKCFKKFLEYIHFDEEQGRIINRKCYGNHLLKLFKKDFYGERFDNISAGIQRHFEYVVSSWVKYWARETKIRTAVFGGGSFMNVKGNMLIANCPEFNDVFFCPSCGDESTALGAAYKISEDHNEPCIYPLESLFLGPEFNDDEIETCLNILDNMVRWERCDHIEMEVAKLIMNNNIVAIFQGPAEWGARALGGRSIVCRADDLKIIHKLNKKIKMRDFWMPFAASIIEDDSDKYLINKKTITAPFMMQCFETTEDAWEKIGAALHQYDSTCRAQLVSEKTSPFLYRVISHFKQMTGHSGLLNTSFNLHGFPIVGKPETALQTFLDSGIDFLAIEKFIVSKR